MCLIWTNGIQCVYNVSHHPKVGTRVKGLDSTKELKFEINSRIIILIKRLIEIVIFIKFTHQKSSIVIFERINFRIQDYER